MAERPRGRRPGVAAKRGTRSRRRRPHRRRRARAATATARVTAGRAGARFGRATPRNHAPTCRHRRCCMGKHAFPNRSRSCVPWPRRVRAPHLGRIHVGRSGRVDGRVASRREGRLRSPLGHAWRLRGDGQRARGRSCLLVRRRRRRSDRGDVRRRAPRRAAHASRRAAAAGASSTRARLTHGFEAGHARTRHLAANGSLSRLAFEVAAPLPHGPVRPRRHPHAFGHAEVGLANQLCIEHPARSGRTSPAARRQG